MSFVSVDESSSENNGSFISFAWHYYQCVLFSDFYFIILFINEQEEQSPTTTVKSEYSGVWLAEAFRDERSSPPDKPHPSCTLVGWLDKSLLPRNRMDATFPAQKVNHPPPPIHSFSFSQPTDATEVQRSMWMWTRTTTMALAFLIISQL